MDLGKLDTSTLANEGVQMELLHPKTDEPIIDERSGEPVTITVLGRDSKQFMRAQHRLANEKTRRRGRVGIDDHEWIEIVAACTKSWKHVYFGSTDEEFPCAFENAVTLYTERPWILEQVGSFIAIRANFLGN